MSHSPGSTVQQLQVLPSGRSTALPQGRVHQYLVFGSLFVAVVVLTALISRSAEGYFARFIGNADPVLVSSAAGLLGAISLALLHRLGGFEILLGQRTLRGIGYAAAAATLLAVEVVAADFLVRYPADTNVPVPTAFLFYPLIGFVAEMAFHVIPLATCLIVLRPLRRWIRGERLVWIALAIVTVAEPTFQVTFQGEPFSWSAVYTWVHVFVIAAVQLYLFRRFDFTSMFAFRLVYYAYWHIIWGVIRLEVLF